MGLHDNVSFLVGKVDFIDLRPFCLTDFCCRCNDPDLVNALNYYKWMVDCGLLLKSHRISKPGIPLAAYQDIYAFKLLHRKLILLFRREERLFR